MLSDGVGALLIACGLQGKPNPKQEPAIRKLSLQERLMKYAAMLTSPYYLSREAIRANLVANDTVKAFNSVTTDYSYATAEAYKVEDLKRVSKKLGCTINDFLMSVYTTCLQKHLIEIHNYQDGPEQAEASMSVCVNIRDAPESLLDYRTGKNYLNYERVSFPMSTDFNVALQRNAEQMNDYKNSHRNYMLYYFLKVVFLVVPTPLQQSFK